LRNVPDHDDNVDILRACRALRANGSLRVPQDESAAALRFSVIERRVRHATGLILF